MPEKYLAVVLAAIAVVIAIYATYQYVRIVEHEDYLDGYWEASTTFCKRSGIQSAQLYFRDDRVYVLIDDGGTVAVNKCVDYTRDVVLDTLLMSGRDTPVEYDIEFDEPVDPLPQRARMIVDMQRGLLGLYIDNTLYMEMFKNHKVTAGII